MTNPASTAPPITDPSSDTPADLAACPLPPTEEEKAANRLKAMQETLHPLPDVDPEDVVSVTIKVRRRDLESSNMFSWDVLATLVDMQEIGIKSIKVGPKPGAPPHIMLSYETYALPEGEILK